MSSNSYTVDPVFGVSKGYGTGAGINEGTILNTERSNASFSSYDMACILYGGSERVHQRRKLYELIENNIVFSRWNKLFLNRSDTYKLGLKKTAEYIKLKKQLKLTDDEHGICMMAIDEQLPIGLHHAMFIPTLMGQASDEQQSVWLTAARNYEIIGTYAQTELAHGSYVRGLETTATYDRFKQNFIIHSPHITSTKWWPGNLGKTSTHCIVMARLIVDQTDYGIHAFIVPIRDMTTHETLPGVTVFDIGPKLGYGMNDNGGLRFNQYRIPHENMLCRFAQLDKNGTYHRPPHAKLSYGTMVYVRSYMISHASRDLARACTIAIRYSAVRRQFDSLFNEDIEEPVINYQTQQSILFHQLSIAYAFHFTGQYMRTLYYATQDKIAAGDVSSLAELHSASSAFKSLCTQVAADGIETLRRSCGGHGYSGFSGFVTLLTDYVPTQTYEGENIVMYLQTARGLMKQYNNTVVKKKSQAAGILSWMNDLSFLSKPAPISNESDLLNPNIQLVLYRHRSARLIVAVNQRLHATMQQYSCRWEQAVEYCKIDLVKAAKAHAYYLILTTFMKGVSDSQLSNSNLSAVLKDMIDMYALSNIEKDLGDYCEDGYLSLQHTDMLRNTIRLLLNKIRVNAVQLVDSFDFTDHYLNSALGRYNGDVYNTLYNWAQLNPLNDTDVPDGIQQYLQPILDQKKFINAKL